MKCNKEGLQIIKDSEGLRLDAYLCASNVLTWGWGHTGPDVAMGKSITLDEAERLLREDISKFEGIVKDCLSHVELNENQFSALVSLCFNCGSAPIQKGNTIRKCLDAGNYQGAANAFLLWVKGGGKTLPGLVTRRHKERDLFLKPVKEEELNNRLYIFKTTQDTWLKNKPVQSSELPKDKKLPLRAASYSVGYLIGEESNHLEVDLIQLEVPEFSIGQYYIFKDHVEVYEMKELDM